MRLISARDIHTKYNLSSVQYTQVKLSKWIKSGILTKDDYVKEGNKYYYNADKIYNLITDYATDDEIEELQNMIIDFEDEFGDIALIMSGLGLYPSQRRARMSGLYRTKITKQKYSAIKNAVEEAYEIMDKIHAP